jgi:hypothetical protein
MQNIPQRPFNSSLHPRDGAPKRTAVVQPVPGQKRQTAGQPHPYHHGVSVEGGAGIPPKTFTGKIPVHDGMTDAQKAKVHPVVNNASVILNDASNLGRPPERT